MNPEKVLDDVLGIVTENFDYFRENPTHLAWAMMNYSIINSASRRTFDDFYINPKEPILELEGELSEEDSNLLYDSWAVSVSNNDEFSDSNPNLLLDGKKNKTLEDWIGLKTDRNYTYHDLYPDEYSVIDYLFCVIGTGMGWNEDGYITDVGPSGVDETIFSGYTRVESEVRMDLREKLLKYVNDESISEEVEILRKNAAINASDNEAEKNYINNVWRVKEELVSLSTKEQKKALEGFKSICYLEAIINEAKHWNKEEWKEARKSNVFNYKGVEFDISEIDVGFMDRSYGYAEEISSRLERGEVLRDYRIAREIMSKKAHLWGYFVHQLKDEDEPKTKEALRVVSVSIIRALKSEDADIDNTQVEEADAYLNSQRPNLEKYKPLLEQAENGDKEAESILNDVSGVPSRGWDSIEFLANYDIEKAFKRRLGILSESKEKQRKHYPLSEYSNMVGMPDNAHESYVKAGIEVAKEIMENSDEPDDSKEFAEQFLEKWDVQ